MFLRGLGVFLVLTLTSEVAHAIQPNCFENAWKALGRPINSRWAIREHTRQRIHQIINDPANRGEVWTCDYGGCVPFSAQLKVALDQVKVNLQNVKVSHQMNLLTEQGPRAGNFYHYFLEDRTWGAGGEIIVDPTIMQFFKVRPVGLDRSGIFVGGREELVAFVKQNKMLLRLPPSMYEIDIRQVNVEDLVDKIWGFNGAAPYKYLNDL